MASDDLDRVTKQAYAQVSSFGMNRKLGVVAFPQQDPNDPFSRPIYSEATSRLIDDEVRDLVSEAYRRTYELLESKRPLLEKLGARLLKDEQLQTADLVDVLGPRPFPERRTYSEIVAEGERRQRRPDRPVESPPPPETNPDHTMDPIPTPP